MMLLIESSPGSLEREHQYFTDISVGEDSDRAAVTPSIAPIVSAIFSDMLAKKVR